MGFSMTYCSQIAANLGVGYGTVRARLQKGVRKNLSGKALRKTAI